MHQFGNFGALTAGILFFCYLITTQEQRINLNKITVGWLLPTAHTKVVTLFSDMARIIVTSTSFLFKNDVSESDSILKLIYNFRWWRAFEISTIFGLSAITLLDFMILTNQENWYLPINLSIPFKSEFSISWSYFAIFFLILIYGYVIRIKCDNYSFRRKLLYLLLYSFVVFFCFPHFFANACSAISFEFFPKIDCSLSDFRIYQGIDEISWGLIFLFESILTSDGIISHLVIFNDLSILIFLVLSYRLRLFPIGMLCVLVSVVLSYLHGPTHLEITNFFVINDHLRNFYSVEHDNIYKIQDFLPWIAKTIIVLLNGLANFAQDGLSLIVSIWLFIKLSKIKTISRITPLLTLDYSWAVFLGVVNLSFLALGAFIIDELLKEFGIIKFQSQSVYWKGFWESITGTIQRTISGKLFDENWVLFKDRYFIALVMFCFSTLLPSLIFLIACMFRLLLYLFGQGLIQIWKTLREEDVNETFSKTLGSYHALIIYFSITVSAIISIVGLVL